MRNQRTILKNARIMTDNTWKYGHLIISEGRIEDIILERRGTGSSSGDSDIIDCQNRKVLPGLYDGHMHLFEYGLDSMTVDLSIARSNDELLSIMDKVHSGEVRNELFERTGIIWGTGYDDSMYPETMSISLKDMDSRYPEHPVLIRRICGHISFANSSFLDIYDVGAPKTKSSRLDDRYWRNSSPRFIIDDEMAQKAYTMSRTLLYSKGVVGGVEILSKDRLLHFTKSYEKCQGGLNLSLSIINNHTIDDGNGLDRILQKNKEESNECPIRFIKSFADGSIGARTASLSRRYSDGTMIGPLLDPPGVKKAIIDSKEHDLLPMIHCIGDLALDSVLSGSKNIEWPVRVEHVEVIRDDQMDKLTNNKYCACLQPNFSDIWGRENGLYHRNLGEHYMIMNRFKIMLDKGINICFGTDMMPPGPLEALKGAVGHPVVRSRISFEKGIELFSERSCNNSYIMNATGTIYKGKRADILILDRSDMVEMLFFKGEIVHNTKKERC